MKNNKNNIVTVIREEHKEYCGIKYSMWLVCNHSQNVKPEESKPEEINDSQNWELEYSKESEGLAKKIANNFLWFDTFKMTGATMQQKYQQCEIYAIDQINFLMQTYPKKRAFWILKEIYLYLYVMAKTTPERIKYYFRKIFNLN